MFERYIFSAKHWFSCFVIPFFVQSLLMIFWYNSIDTNFIPGDLRNSLPIISIFIFYIVGIFSFHQYYKSEGGPDELFGEFDIWFFVLLIEISYPFFFLFHIPFVIIGILKKYGTPRELWEKAFLSTFMSIDYLSCQETNALSIVGYIIYIGFPYALFSIIYLGILILLTPLWLMMFSPFGFGIFGISSWATITSYKNPSMSLSERVLKVYPWGLLINTFVIYFHSSVFSLIHILNFGRLWYNVPLFLVSTIAFVFDCVPAIKNYFFD